MALLVLWAGCGKVQFVASPYTPQSVEIAYAPAEDLTVFAWQLATPDLSQVRFELAAPDGTFQPIDFSAAPYPSGTWACAQGSCAQLVVRGPYKVPPGLRSPIRAIHSRYGSFPGTPWTERTVDPTLEPTASFPEGNAAIALAAADHLLGGPLSRKLGFAVWAQPSGDCGQPPDTAATGLLSARMQSLQAPRPLDDTGRYCVGIHGVPGDGGPAPTFAKVALTYPETARTDFDYKPPVQATPVLAQLILDLETADPSRCSAVHQALLDTLRGALRAADPNLHEFDPAPLDLAQTCQQDPNRTFDAAAMADGIKQWIHSNETVYANRVVLFYANNLSTAVPPALSAALTQLPGDFTNDPRVGTWYWGMVAGGATPGVPYDLEQPWTAIEDPGFARNIATTVQQTLPFQTELHDNDVPVALLSGDALLNETGNLLKLCQASPPVTLAEGTIPATDLFVTITPGSPPGFYVELPPKITVPRAQFVQDDVVVRFEICRRFCDHPFQNDAGIPADSWKGSTECVHNQSP